MPDRALAPLAAVASALALVAGWLVNRRVGRLAARIACDEERARVLALLNRRPDCGSGEAMLWKLWRHQMKAATGGHPRMTRRSPTLR